MNLRQSCDQLNRRFSRVARGGTRHYPLRPVTAQALVEFVLVSVPLLATMFFIFEFGIAFFELQQLNQVVSFVARDTAACANQCDGAPPDVYGDNKNYKDVKAFLDVMDRNVDQRNGTKLATDQIEYILIRRSADSSISAGNQEFAVYTNAGQTDISRIYQLYVYDSAAKSNNKFIPFKDGAASDALKIGLPDPTKDSSGNTHPFNNSNYLSSPCLGTANGSTIANTYGTNAAAGFDFTCRYYSTTSSDPNLQALASDPNFNWSRGRPICQPSERFYVEIGYRHHWVTPFFPQVGNVSLSAPKNDNGYVILRQKTYAKVEPRFFPVEGGTCPTGVS
jgi:hypothetical protein